MDDVFIFFNIFLNFAPMFFQHTYYDFPEKGSKKEGGVFGVLSLIIGLPLSVVYGYIHYHTNSLFNNYYVNTIVFIFIPIFIFFVFIFNFCNNYYDKKYLRSEAKKSLYFKLLYILILLLISFCFSVYIFHVLNYYNAEEFGYRYVQIRGIREVRSFVPGRNGRDNYSYYALLKKSLLNVTEIRLSCGKPKDFINDSCLKIKVYKGGIGIPFIEPDIDMKAVPRCNIFIDIKDVPNELIANNEDLKEKLKPQTLDKNLPLNGY